MRFGITFTTFVYGEERKAIVARALNSLQRTNVTGLVKPVMKITYGPSNFDYTPYIEKLGRKFEVTAAPDPPYMQKPDTGHLMGQEAAIRLLKEYSDVTHVVFLWDDQIYNPDWLRQLAKLIERHPDGVAWAVYRSAYTDYHRIIGGDGTDVLMTMHDGIGCVTREEWESFVAEHGFVWAPDISHAGMRPGNRWATKRDYMENIGRHYDRGIGDVDGAIDFVGEEEINA